MKKFFSDNIAVVCIVTFLLASVACYFTMKNSKSIKLLGGSQTTIPTDAGDTAVHE